MIDNHLQETVEMTAIKEKLSKQVLSVTIKNHILSLILQEKIKPGERIVERTLAKELGVSQAPVREALRDLVLIGILRNETYHGTFLCDFSVQEILEAYQVRAAIESMGIKLAVERMTEEEIASLKKIYDKMLHQNVKKNLTKLIELDNQFHGEIMRLSGNKVLYHLWNTLKYDIWTKISYNKISDKKFLAARHSDLIAAITQKNASAAAEAMKHHILDLEDVFAKEFKNQIPSS